MKDSLKMIVVLTLICGVCGFLLAGVRHATAARIEDQIMEYVKGPAVEAVLTGVGNNPVQDRRTIRIGDRDVTVFLGKTNGRIESLAFETTADGFGGEMGVMVGYDLQKDELTGIGITSQKETPGVGARVTQTEFTERFAGKPIDTNFHIAKDGGQIDALTGATISSRAVCTAVRESAEEFPKIRAAALRQ